MNGRAAHGFMTYYQDVGDRNLRISFPFSTTSTFRVQFTDAMRVILWTIAQSPQSNVQMCAGKAVRDEGKVPQRIGASDSAGVPERPRQH